MTQGNGSQVGRDRLGTFHSGGPLGRRLGSSRRAFATPGDSLVGSGRARRVGLALSGGGALGGAHIGVLKVLEECGIRPYCVSGTSAGSAVGAVYCAGMSLDRIEEVAHNLEWNQLGRVIRPKCGFFDGSRLEQHLIELIGDRTFDQLVTPFACAAVDILTEEVIILREGRLAPAVRASCAFPGVFTPVDYYKGRLLVDGGLLNNMPVAVLREMGADYVIAVDLSGSAVPRKPPASLLEMWFVSFSVLTRMAHHESVLADVVIRPDVRDCNWVDLSKLPELIERGRQAASTKMPGILDYLNAEAEMEDETER